MDSAWDHHEGRWPDWLLELSAQIRHEMCADAHHDDDVCRHYRLGLYDFPMANWSGLSWPDPEQIF